MDGEDSLRCKFIVKIDPPPPLQNPKQTHPNVILKLRKKNRNS